MTSTEDQFDTAAAEYRADFAYLTDHEYELLCMAAAQNYDGTDDAEAAASFGASLDSFTQFSRSELFYMVGRN